MMAQDLCSNQALVEAAGDGQLETVKSLLNPDYSASKQTNVYSFSQPSDMVTKIK